MARRAHSLATLLAQVNARAPNRDKSSDGWIGDAAHAATKSEHNPNAAGVVRAIDITHDPADGFDSWAFAEMLRARADQRILYIISNHRIANPGQPWRPYSGKNPHDHHVHISVVADAKRYDDSREWDIGGDWVDGKDSSPATKRKPVLKQGSKGADVEKLQQLLKMTAAEQDGIFGPKTAKAVIAFQKAVSIVPDAIVGPQTWAKLEE
jgi:hypothetical protein